MRWQALLFIALLALQASAFDVCPECDQSFILTSVDATHVSAELKLMKVSADIKYDPNAVIEEIRTNTLNRDQKLAEYGITDVPEGEEVSFFGEDGAPLLNCNPVKTDAKGTASCKVEQPKAACQEITVKYKGSALLNIKGTTDSAIFCSQESIPLNAIAKAVRESASDPRCVPVFILIGLLLASMFYSGKSPLSLFDITTPRLPKGKKQRIGRTLVQKNWMQLRRIVAIQDKIMGRNLEAANKRFGEELGKNRGDLKKRADDIINSKARAEDKAAALKALALGVGDRAINSILAGTVKWDKLEGGRSAYLYSKALVRLASPELREAFAYLNRSLMVKESNLATKQIMDKCLGTGGWVGKVPLVGGALGVFVVHGRVYRDAAKTLFIESKTAGIINKQIVGRISPDRAARFGAWIEQNRAGNTRVGNLVDALRRAETKRKEISKEIKDTLIAKLYREAVNRGFEEKAVAILKANSLDHVDPKMAANARDHVLDNLMQLIGRKAQVAQDAQAVLDRMNYILKSKTAPHDIEVNAKLAQLMEEHPDVFNITSARIARLEAQAASEADPARRRAMYEQISAAFREVLEDKMLLGKLSGGKALQEHEAKIRQLATEHGVQPLGKSTHEIEAEIRAKGSAAASQLDDMKRTYHMAYIEPELRKMREGTAPHEKSIIEAVKKEVKGKYTVSEAYEQGLKDLARQHNISTEGMMLLELREALESKSAAKAALAKLLKETKAVQAGQVFEVEMQIVGKKKYGAFELSQAPEPLREYMLLKRIERDINERAPNSYRTLHQDIAMDANLLKEMLKRGLIKDKDGRAITELKTSEDVQAYKEAIKRGVTYDMAKNGVWVASSDGTYMPYYRDADNPFPKNPADKVINGRVMVKVSKEGEPEVWDRYTPKSKKHAEILEGWEGPHQHEKFVDLYSRGVIDLREKMDFNARSNRVYGGLASLGLKVTGFFDRIAIGSMAGMSKNFQQFEAISELNRQVMTQFRDEFLKGEYYDKMGTFNKLQKTALPEAYKKYYTATNQAEKSAAWGKIQTLQAQLQQVKREAQHEFRNNEHLQQMRAVSKMPDLYTTSLGGISMRDIKAAHSGYGIIPHLSHLYHLGPASQLSPHQMFGGLGPMGKLTGYAMMPSYIFNLGISTHVRPVELLTMGYGNRWDSNQLLPFKRRLEGLLSFFKPQHNFEGARVPNFRGVSWERYLWTDEGVKYLSPMVSKNIFNEWEILGPTPLGQNRFISRTTWGYDTKFLGMDLSKVPLLGKLFQDGRYVKEGRSGHDYVTTNALVELTDMGIRGEGEVKKRTMRKAQEDFPQYKNIGFMSIPGVAYKTISGQWSLVPRMALAIESAPEWKHLVTDKVKKEANMDIWARDGYIIHQQMEREQEFRGYTPEKFFSGMIAFPPLGAYQALKGAGSYIRNLTAPKQGESLTSPASYGEKIATAYKKARNQVTACGKCRKVKGRGEICPHCGSHGM